MTKKRTLDSRSTMKNWTSCVHNAVSSRGHKGWRGLKFGKNLLAKSARLETVLGRRRVRFLRRWAKIEMSLSPFSLGIFCLYRHADLVQKREVPSNTKWPIKINKGVFAERFEKKQKSVGTEPIRNNHLTDSISTRHWIAPSRDPNTARQLAGVRAWQV